MIPKYHILLGLIISATIFFIFPQITFLAFLIIWASSVLIDVDHYLFYVFIKKDWSLKNAHKWFMERHHKFQSLSKTEKKQALKKANIPCFLHGIEAIIILILLYSFMPFLNNFFLYILIGFLIHEFLDFLYIIFGGYTLRHLGSQTYNIIQFKKRLAKP